jgi:hypothetical protein
MNLSHEMPTNMSFRKYLQKPHFQVAEQCTGRRLYMREIGTLEIGLYKKYAIKKA